MLPTSHDNYIAAAWRFVALVVALLLLLSYLPAPWIRAFGLRPVHLFSELTQPDSLVVAATDSLNTTLDSLANDPNTPDGPLATAPCPKGLTCIADFGETAPALSRFAKALQLLKTQKRSKVRIAWFGDSFTEGDMLTALVRDSLQRQYGGEGVGFMPITSPVAKSRPTIVHSYSNWTTYSVLDKTTSPAPLGICGETFVPQGAGTVVYGGTKFLGAAETLDQVRFFYSDAAATATVSVSLDHAAEAATKLTADEKTLHALNLHALGTTRLSAVFKGKMRVYGASLETDNGVYLDNFSLRGNPGRKLKVIDTALLRQFNALQDYDLVVLQFGLNVCDKSTTNYDFYEKEMFATVQHLQTILPKASFLLIGVSDRSTHDDAGNLVSFAYIDLLTTAQRKVAERTHIAFWDMRKAMGGNGSMAIWAKNGFANTDYTHLTWGGGKKMGALLYTALKASIAE